MMKRLLIAFFLTFIASAVFIVLKPNPYTGNIVLIGPPGSGKGTVAEQLSKETQLPVLTVSRVLKDAAKVDPVLDTRIQAFMEQGELVPDALIEQVISKVITQPKYQNGIIFDGFPRTLAQAQFFINNNIPVDLVVVLDAPDDVIIKRLSGRRVHPPSGRLYHLISKPPKQDGVDDVTGEALIQRADDKPEVIQKRLNDYDALTRPIINWAQEEVSKQGIVKNIRTIDAQQPLEDVIAEVEAIMLLVENKHYLF